MIPKTVIIETYNPAIKNVSGLTMRESEPIKSSFNKINTNPINKIKTPSIESYFLVLK